MSDIISECSLNHLMVARAAFDQNTPKSDFLENLSAHAFLTRALISQLQSSHLCSLLTSRDTCCLHIQQMNSIAKCREAAQEVKMAVDVIARQGKKLVVKESCYSQLQRSGEVMTDLTTRTHS